ncbi:dTMP kinase [Candidatus Woesearchaeota archaeon]|nr:dTMP kinase [Candidatus Woesearchaeota archaeon]
MTLEKVLNDGLFIVLDGLDGSGKGTQIKLLANWLFDNNKYFTIILTREPDNTVYTREIRRILKESKDPKENAEQLAELFVEDRKEHCSNLIAPALHHGRIIVSDRYKYSTLAYQQTQGIFLQKLIDMHKGLIVPNIVFILDIPAEIALQRIAKDSGREYKEVFEKIEFQKQLRENYLKLQSQLPEENILIIDANRLVQEVHEELKEYVMEELK